jgi:signal transduction histidine kinase
MELKRRMDKERLERLVDLGPSFADELDMDTVLSRVLDAARDLTGARYAALGVVNATRTGLERFITVGLKAGERERIGDLPRGRGVLGELINNPHPLRLADVGRHPRSYGFPVGHPPMTTFLGAPVVAGDDVFGNLYLTEKADGAEFTEEDEETLVVIARWAGAAIQRARTYGGLNERHRELQRRVDLLETTDEITRAIGAETDVARVLDLVAKRARALAGARGVTLAVARGGNMVVECVAGELSVDLVGLAVPEEESAAAYALRERRPVRLRDVPDGLKRRLHDTVELQAGLLVPMIFRDRALGVISVFDRLEDGPEFDAEDERRLTAFAASTSIAVATAQSAAQETLRRSIEASEEERKRWARELHDETLQQLGAVRLMLSASLQSEADGALETAARQAVDELAHASSALRDLINDLRPAALDQLGVMPALEALVRRVRRYSNAEIGLHVDLAYDNGAAEARLLPELENGIYRVAQEAINNAIKHAHASRIEVSLVEADGTVELSVRDNGAGFDSNAQHSGFGLTGMRERVAQLGGRFEMGSGESGTTIEVVLPATRADVETPPATSAPA